MATSSLRPMARPPIGALRPPSMEWNGITFTVELVTPEKAVEYLVGNTINRPLRPKHLDSLVRQMTMDLWLFTSMPIGLTADGELVNGQHTLEAILASEKPQYCLIVRGLNKNVRYVLDDGAKLNYGDVLVMEHDDAPQPKTSAAVVRRIGLWEKGQTYSKAATVFRNSELSAITTNHPGVFDAVRATNSKSLKKLAPHSLWAFLYYVISQTDEGLCQQFLSEIETGAGLDKGSPVLALRNYLLDQVSKSARRSGADAESEILKRIVKTWNFYRDGKSMTYCRLKEGEKPELEV